MSPRLRLVLAVVLGVSLMGPAPAESEVVSRHALSNGMTVLVRATSEAPVVAVSLQTRGGSHVETAKTAGITNFLQRVLLRGTAKRSALALAEAAEDIGGQLDAAGDVESAHVRGEALARHWEALLELVAEVALSPAFPAEEIEKERRLILSQVRARADSPFQAGLDGLLRELYGSHPYAWPSLGTRESLKHLTRDDLLTRYHEIYRPEAMVLAVSGQVETARVVKVVERLFGKLSRPGGGHPVVPPIAAPRAVRRVLEHPAHQAHVIVGYLGPGLGDVTYPAVRVLTTVLGGGMSSRLFTALRDRQGLTYSVGALAPYRTGPTFIAAYAGTAPEAVAEAEAGVLHEIERLRSNAVGKAEVERAKAYLLGHLAMDRLTNARRAWYLAFFEAVGAGADFPERHARAVEAVTAEDVASAARRWLSHPSVVVVTPPR